MPVVDIQPADVLVPIRKIERKGNRESARRCLQFVSRVGLSPKFLPATSRALSRYDAHR
ncbi:hypothetical protein ACFODU_09245, partial [Altererythrobacter palmitatis]